MRHISGHPPVLVLDTTVLCKPRQLRPSARTTLRSADSGNHTCTATHGGLSGNDIIEMNVVQVSDHMHADGILFESCVPTTKSDAGIFS